MANEAPSAKTDGSGSSPSRKDRVFAGRNVERPRHNPAMTLNVTKHHGFGKDMGGALAEVTCLRLRVRSQSSWRWAR